MKFLIDRCAGRRLAEALRSRGHDVAEARLLGPDPGDSALLERAVREGRILVTIDVDFGRLVFAEGATHTGVVRLPDVPVAQRISLMDQVIQRYGAELEAGSVITVRGLRIRITRRRS